MSLLWVKTAAPTGCVCEHIVHMHDEMPHSEWHPYGQAEAGGNYVREISGNVCDDCARTHMKDYVR